jgi:probable phosphoglycerate mutase
VIYLCRHGQTAFNRDGRIQGQCESALTPLGEAQAAAMGDLLHRRLGAETAGWRLVASPLGRAQASARIIGERLGLPVQLEPRLKEVSVGAWEGRLREEVRADHPDLFVDHGWMFHGPGGETYGDVLVRVSAWLAEQGPDDARRLIVVSHGVAGRLLRGAYAGLSRADTIAQDIPQNALFALDGGRIDRLECEPV